MASITIPKFFKQAQITSGHTTAEGLAAIIGSNPQWTGIGITWAGDNITGMTAFGKSIDFTMLGGGSITSYFSPNTGNLQYVKPNGHQDNIMIGWAQNTYATVSTLAPSTGQSPVDTINYIQLGLTMATLNGTSTDVTTDGLMDGTRTKNLINGIIGTLDVTEYAQGAIDTTTTTGQTTITIKGIQETDGKISAGSSTVDTNIVVDGTYNASTNKIATQNTVSTAIGNLHSFAITLGTDGTTTTYAPQTADATLTIPTYAGNTIGLVPAKTSTTASTGKYLSEAGSWESIPVEKLYTIEAGSVSSNVIALNLKKDGTAVANTINFGVANQNSSDTTYGLYISGNGNAVNYGLNTATSTALGKADTALQPVAAVAATNTFTTAAASSGTGTTVTATKVSQATDAQMTVDNTGANSFTIGDGTLTIQVEGTSKGTFTANATDNTTINLTAQDFGLDSAMHFVGVSTTDPSTSGATVSGHNTWSKGDVVIYQRTGETGYVEYVNINGNNTSASWELLGDADSYALKSVTITGDGTYITGGGDLSQNRQLSHATRTESTTTGTARTAVAGTEFTIPVKSYTFDGAGHETAVETTDYKLTIPEIPTAYSLTGTVNGESFSYAPHTEATTFTDPFAWESVTL